MTTAQWLGVAVLALPFVGLTAYVVREDGWLEAASMWAFVTAVVAVCLLGSALVVGVLK